MPNSTLFDYGLRIYRKVFTWKFRDRYGAPLIGLLMSMNGNRVSFKDYSVFLNPHDKTATELFLIHASADDWIWESFEIDLFLASVKANPGCVIVDLGANYGAYTLSCCALPEHHYTKTIIAVEPNPDTFASLKKSVEFSGFEPQVQLVNAAVSSRHNVECDFYAHQSYSAMSKTMVTTGEISLSENGAPRKVRGVTLDGLLSDMSIGGANTLVIKMDIEGSEPLALEGMETTLGSARGYQMFFELHPGALKASGHNPIEFVQRILDLKPDVVAEIDQHEKTVRRIRDLADFTRIVTKCMTTTEMWHDYTNIFVSKNAELPSEVSKLPEN